MMLPAIIGKFDVTTTINGHISSDKSLKLSLDGDTHEHLGICSCESVRQFSMVLLVIEV